MKAAEQYTLEEQQQLIDELNAELAGGQMPEEKQYRFIDIVCTSKLPENSRVRDIVARKGKISREDIADFRAGELQNLEWFISRAFEILRGHTREKQYRKYEAVLTETNKADIESFEQITIVAALKAFMRKSVRTPTLQELHREATVLCYDTILRHLPSKDYNKGIFELMNTAVLNTLFYSATTLFEDGTYNVKAARLYLEATGLVSSAKVKHITNTTQNNFLQINNTVLNQEAIESLKPEQRKLIEGVITGTISESDYLEFVETKTKANDKRKNSRQAKI